MLAACIWVTRSVEISSIDEGEDMLLIIDEIDFVAHRGKDGRILASDDAGSDDAKGGGEARGSVKSCRSRGSVCHRRGCVAGW